MMSPSSSITSGHIALWKALIHHASVGILCVAVMVLAGWIFGIEPLKHILPLLAITLFLIFSGIAWGSSRSINRIQPKGQHDTEGLQDSEQNFRLLVQGVEDYAIFMLHPDGRVASWNAGAERLKGYTATEIVGRHFSCFYTPQDLASGKPDAQLDGASKAGHIKAEGWRVRKDGSLFWAEVVVTAIHKTSGSLVGFAKVTRDMTEPKRNLEVLTHSKARLDGIISSAIDAIISIDGHQQVVIFNPAAEKMFGVSACEALGKSINHLIPERFRAGHTHHVDTFGKTGVSMRQMGALGTLSGLRASGEEFPIEASISQVEVRGEKLFTVILRDITERKKAELALEQAQAALQAHAEALEETVAERTARLRETVSELEAFSYSLSHDMRGPLRAINSFTRIVLEEHRDKLGSHGSEMMERIISSGQRLDRLIDDVLAFSRVSQQEIDLKSVDLEMVVRQILHEHPELQPPHAEILIASPLLPVLGHEASLTQCLTNLLGNAVKFVAQGVKPCVRIWTEIQSHSQAASLNPHLIRIWIEDNGIGIVKNAQGKLFELFERNHQTNYEGTGVGLAIVRKAAQRMSGQVGVESEPGQGSAFWLELKRPG